MCWWGVFKIFVGASKIWPDPPQLGRGVCSLSGPTSFSLATSVTNSNRRLGKMHQDCAPRSFSGLKLSLRFRYFPESAPRCQTPRHFHLLWLFAEAIIQTALSPICASVSTLCTSGALANVSLFRFSRSDLLFCCDFEFCRACTRDAGRD